MLKELTDFGTWIKVHKFNGEQAATKLNITRQMVSMLSLGKTVPGVHIAARIENWTRSVDPQNYISMLSWTLDEMVGR